MTYSSDGKIVLCATMMIKKNGTLEQFVDLSLVLNLKLKHSSLQLES